MKKCHAQINSRTMDATICPPLLDPESLVKSNLPTQPARKKIKKSKSLKSDLRPCQFPSQCYAPKNAKNDEDVK